MPKCVSQLSRLQSQILKAEQEDQAVYAIHMKMKKDKARRLQAVISKLKKKQSKLVRIQLKAEKRNIQKESIASEKSRALYALRAIRFQYPDNPEGILMYELLKGAVIDLFSSKVELMKGAVNYLNSNMIHAQLCDVDPDWIRKKLKQAHVHVDARKLV